MGELNVLFSWDITILIYRSVSDKEEDGDGEDESGRH